MQFREIIDHRKDKSAVERSNAPDGQRSKPMLTTRGWKVLVKWVDETNTWIDLKDVKEASQVELNKYTVSKKNY